MGICWHRTIPYANKNSKCFIWLHWCNCQLVGVKCGVKYLWSPTTLTLVVLKVAEKIQIFLCEVTIWNVNCAHAITLIFESRTDVLEKVSKFWDRKSFDPWRIRIDEAVLATKILKPPRHQEYLRQKCTKQHRKKLFAVQLTGSNSLEPLHGYRRISIWYSSQSNPNCPLKACIVEQGLLYSQVYIG